MARLNVSVPDELIELAKRRHPSMNVSRVLQEGLRRALECEHDHVACDQCGDELELEQLRRLAVDRFYREVMLELERQLHRGATLEGFARVLRQVGLEHTGSAATTATLPRLTRAEREDGRRPPLVELEATA